MESKVIFIISSMDALIEQPVTLRIWAAVRIRCSHPRQAHFTLRSAAAFIKCPACRPDSAVNRHRDMPINLPFVGRPDARWTMGALALVLLVTLMVRVPLLDV